MMIIIFCFFSCLYYKKKKYKSIPSSIIIQSYNTIAIDTVNKPYNSSSQNGLYSVTELTLETGRYVVFGKVEFIPGSNSVTKTYSTLTINVLDIMIHDSNTVSECIHAYNEGGSVAVRRRYNAATLPYGHCNTYINGEITTILNVTSATTWYLLVITDAISNKTTLQGSIRGRLVATRIT